MPAAELQACLPHTTLCECVRANCVSHSRRVMSPCCSETPNVVTGTPLLLTVSPIVQGCCRRTNSPVFCSGELAAAACLASVATTECCSTLEMNAAFPHCWMVVQIDCSVAQPDHTFQRLSQVEFTLGSYQGMSGIGQ